MTTNRHPSAFCALTIFLSLLLVSSVLAAGQNEFLVYSFPHATDQSMAAGCLPQGTLVADGAGNLYGATRLCGLGAGTVFKISRPVPPSKQWTESVLYSFTGGLGGSGTLDGRYPQTGVIFDAVGNLFGTALGGANGLGVVFELSPPTGEGGQWTESVLYSFQGGESDGALSPRAWNTAPTGSVGLVMDGGGNLYGATPYGGSGLQEYGLSSTGVVYRLTPPLSPRGSWTETVLHSLTARKGAITPTGNLIFDGKGNLYGATQGQIAMGHHLGAAAYKLTPPTTEGGAWAYRLLFSFGGPEDAPQAGFTIHNNGRLYGTTQTGGQNAEGSVFELVPPAAPGEAWTENVLHTFDSTPNDGLQPSANVVFDNVGNLYGTTLYGGTGVTHCSTANLAGCGTVYKLTPPTSSVGDWAETILHSFESAPDGLVPSSALFRWTNGVLFGVTADGGRGQEGAVFGVAP